MDYIVPMDSTQLFSERFNRIYNQRIEEIALVIKNFPRLKNKPINISFFITLIFSLLMILPICFIRWDNESFDIQIYNLLNIYLPILIVWVMFALNQRLLVPKIFFRRRFFLFVVQNLILLGFLLFVRDLILYTANWILAPEVSLFQARSSLPFGKFVFDTSMFLLLTIISCLINITLYSYGAQMQFYLFEQIKRKAEIESELSFLKMQLAPHFLFNSLNNIIALMDFDTRLAQKSAFALSDVLRSILYEAKAETISLEKELSIVENYIALEKLRLGEDFNFSIDISCRENNRPIASLLLLPLVENLFKHSHVPSGESFIRLSIHEENGRLEYFSENSFSKKEGEKTTRGIGMEILRQRLEFYYPENFEFDVFQEENVYRVRLSLNLDAEVLAKKI